MRSAPVRHEIADAADALSPADPDVFRAALGRFASGVVAVCGLTGPTSPTGFAASAFTSVSLDPLLIAFCPSRTSRTWPRLRTSGRVSVSVLRAGQEDICRALATRDDDKFAAVPWTSSPSGLPLVDGALAWLECTVTAEHPAGDHNIVVSHVDGLTLAPDSAEHLPPGPLVHYRGDYARLA